MKSLDTNILIRFLVNDDTVLANKVHNLFLNAENNKEAFFVTNLVLLEMLHVLSSVYSYTNNEILHAFSKLKSMEILHFENPLLLYSLLKEGQTVSIELADLFIALSGKYAKMDTTITFDKKAARSDFFELLD